MSVGQAVDLRLMFYPRKGFTTEHVLQRLRMAADRLYESVRIGLEYRGEEGLFLTCLPLISGEKHTLRSYIGVLAFPEHWTPCLASLPAILVNLACDVHWEEEKQVWHKEVVDHVARSFASLSSREVRKCRVVPMNCVDDDVRTNALARCNSEEPQASNGDIIYLS